MLNLNGHFFDIVQTALPSIPLDKIENIKFAINQFNLEGKSIKITSELLDCFSQGDIISGIPFIYYERDGNQSVGVYNAMVLSNTCDIQRNENILVAPIFPVSEYIHKDITSLKKNYIYEFMYFDDIIIGESYINFGIINSINRVMIEEGIKLNKFNRIRSLTDIGYYMFIL